MDFSEIPAGKYLLEDWKILTNTMQEKLERKFYEDLKEVCTNTYNELHGKAQQAGYESIFGLKKGKVL